MENLAVISALKWLNVTLQGLLEVGIISAMVTGDTRRSRRSVGYPGIVANFEVLLISVIQVGWLELFTCSRSWYLGLAATALYLSGQQALGWPWGLISIPHHDLV